MTNRAIAIAARTVDWRGWRFAAPLLLTLLLAAVAWVRLSAAAQDTMWAEDGVIFLGRAAQPELLTAGVFTPYAGYTHVLSQSIAIVVWSLVPIGSIAVAFSAASCLVAGAVGGAIYAIARRWGINIAGSLLMAGITVLVPGLTTEVLGNLANLHWFLLWLTPFVLLLRPRTWLGAAGLALVLFVIGTSEIQSFVFAPLLLWRIRDPRRWPLAFGFVLAGAVQFAILDGVGQRGTTPSILSVIDGYFFQVPLAGLLGSSNAASVVIGETGWVVAYAAVIPFLACGIWFAWRSARRWRLVALFVSASVVLWCFAFIVNYHDSFDYAAMDRSQLTIGSGALRYAVVPTMFLFGLVALGVGDRRRGGPRRRTASVAVGIATLAVMAIAFHPYDVSPLRASGPDWRSSITTAAQECADGDEGSVTIPIAPEGWTVDLPCDRLTQ